MENEDKATDPGIVKLKLKQEVTHLRDALRETRFEAVDVASRHSRELNELAAKHNELVELADREAKKSAFRGMLLSATITHSSLLMVTSWIDGTITLQAVVLTTLFSACVAGIHHTMAMATSIWDGEDEEAE